MAFEARAVLWLSLLCVLVFIGGVDGTIFGAFWLIAGQFRVANAH